MDRMSQMSSPTLTSARSPLTGQRFMRGGVMLVAKVIARSSGGAVEHDFRKRPTTLTRQPPHEVSFEASDMHQSGGLGTEGQSGRRLRPEHRVIAGFTG